MEPKKLKMRPYARLLTMLGDQLIKNEKIALVELIKNSYDADANWVEVRFEDFNEDMTYRENSRILVRDDGSGMTLDTIQRHWMNPAAPKKLIEKQEGKNKTPKKKRIKQGEKGIGRFTILKLGREIRITTRAEGEDSETTLLYDFSRFDEDFLKKDGQRMDEIYLDDIEIECHQSFHNLRLGEEHGTEIAISNLKESWSKKIIDELCQDVDNLTDPISRIKSRDGEKSEDRDEEKPADFEIKIYCNGDRKVIGRKESEELRSLIETKTVLDVRGHFDSENGVFGFQTNPNDEQSIEIKDPKITGLWLWRRRFGKNSMHVNAFECGGFGFQFYIFDFARGIGGRHELTANEKSILKKHRIYLYRDVMRVYPYGDPDDDWLNIDVDRGTGRAGHFFSNDQIVGWVDITHEENPKLRDKTNREGLIETGGAAEDFKFLIRIFLSYIRQNHYARHQLKQKKRAEHRKFQDDKIARLLEELGTALEKQEQKSHVQKVERIQIEYESEKNYFSQRIETTEDLAGVGLSVEMASHDIMLMITRAEELGTGIAQIAKDEGLDHLKIKTDTLVGVLHQVVDGMQDVQTLFKSSLRQQRLFEVARVLNRVYKIYSGLLEKSDVLYRENLVGNAALRVRTTDGLLMQVFINLFDNASYWLDTVSVDREICITINGDNEELIFSDSGPGIDEDDLPYIFEPFYSGKGESGRGLGLYIARQLLERHGFSIAVAEGEQKVLSGANFVINFEKENRS